MGVKTNIAWTTSTWNALRGCSRVSEGCRSCYAEKVAYRFSGVGQAYEGLAILKNGHASWTGNVAFIEKHLFDPFRWREPRKIFVNSMSDLFHENVPDEWIDRIFAVMALCPQHIFQVLTKRPERMLRYLSDTALYARVLFQADSIRRIYPKLMEIPISDPSRFPLPNVWWGVSAENQKTADERIPLLLKTPASVRFISAEPLLESINLTWLRIAWQCSGCRGYFSGKLQKNCPTCGKADYWTGSHAFNPRGGQIGSGLDWVIVGGESGAGARLCDVEWIRNIKKQCADAKVPVFVKQLGSNSNWTVNGAVHAANVGIGIECEHGFDVCPKCDGKRQDKMWDRKGSNPDEWPDDLRVQEYPVEAAYV